MVWIQQARFSQRSAFITEHQSYLCNALLILLMVWLCIQWPEVFVWLQRLGAVRVVGVTCAACSFQCLDKMQFPVSMPSTEAGVNSWSVMRKNRHRCSKWKCRKGVGGLNYFCSGLRKRSRFLWKDLQYVAWSVPSKCQNMVVWWYGNSGVMISLHNWFPHLQFVMMDVQGSETGNTLLLCILFCTQQETPTPTLFFVLPLPV